MPEVKAQKKHKQEFLNAANDNSDSDDFMVKKKKSKKELAAEK